MGTHVKREDSLTESPESTIDLSKNLESLRRIFNQERRLRLSRPISETASSSQRCATLRLIATAESTGTQSKSRLIWLVTIWLSTPCLTSQFVMVESVRVPQDPPSSS